MKCRTVKNYLMRNLVNFISNIAQEVLKSARYVYPWSVITDLETIINWIAHPFELSELILKPEYL